MSNNIKFEYTWEQILRFLHSHKNYKVKPIPSPGWDLSEYYNNLEWCTFQYNLNYGSRVERARKSRSIPIVQMDIDGNFIREWESSMEAGRNGFTQQGINKCINGKAYQHHGYRWEKLSDYNK